MDDTDRSHRTSPPVKSIEREDGISPMTSMFDTEVRPLIDLIEKLRGFGLDKDISLPAVAVIGDQSAGKSSVLEAISGVQLPKGTGKITRCPLEIRMKHTKDEDRWEARISYRDLSGENKDIPISEPQSVESLVHKAQSEMTYHEMSMSDNPITLDVTSSDVPDLTLIDLPGIATNALEGQLENTDSRTEALIRKYIQRQKTIVLVVVPCNIDIANCHALKMAQEFDNNGIRTLGVLIKPDLLARGTESRVMEILNNKAFPLSMGYVIVKCRGQEDMEQGQSLKDAMETETEFFTQQFCAVRPSQWGIIKLSKRLSQELKIYLKTFLPDLKKDVRRKLRETEEELNQLESVLPDTTVKKRHLALMMVTNFIIVMSAISNGRQCNDPNIPKEANGFFKQTRKSFSKLSTAARRNEPDIKDEELRNQFGQTMMESRGREFSNYIAKFEVVEGFVKEYMKKMQDPVLHCFDDVIDKTTDVLKLLITFCFHKMPTLASKAEDTIIHLISKTRTDGIAEIRRYLLMETLVYSQDFTYRSELEKEVTTRTEKEKKDKTGTVFKGFGGFCPSDTSSGTTAWRGGQNYFGFSQKTSGKEENTRKENEEMDTTDDQFKFRGGFSIGSNVPRPLSTARRRQKSVSCPGAPFRNSSLSVNEEDKKEPRPSKVHESLIDRAVLSLKSYYQIATRRLCDMVPMIIQQLIFRDMMDELRKDLMDIASDDSILEHFHEDEDTAYTRKECKSRLEMLHNVMQEFDKI